MYKTNILKVSRQVKWKVQLLAQNADTFCKIFAETLKIIYEFSGDSLRVVDIYLEI